MGTSNKNHIKRNKARREIIKSKDPINIFKELAQIKENGFTTKEIAQAIGMNEKWVQRHLDEVGAIYIGKKRVKNRVGVLQSIPCYRIKK